MKYHVTMPIAVHSWINKNSDWTQNNLITRVIWTIYYPYLGICLLKIKMSLIQVIQGATVEGPPIPSESATNSSGQGR